MNLERRYFDIQLRAKTPDPAQDEQDDKPMVVEGYAAVFNSMSAPLGYFGFRERILPGAFEATLADTSHDIYALWNHDTNWPLASRDSGTLTLEEDDKGLKVSITLIDSDFGENAYAAIQAGIVKKMSFGFMPLEDEWSMVGDEEVRDLKKIHLLEVSPVVFPAYSATEIEARSADSIYARKKGCSVEELIALRSQKPVLVDQADLIAAQQRSLRLRLAQAQAL